MTVRGRLACREIGSTVEEHLQHSAAVADALDAGTANWVHPIHTDERTVGDIAAAVAQFTEWTAEPSNGS